jgi:hypothetical protein
MANSITLLRFAATLALLIGHWAIVIGNRFFPES